MTLKRFTLALALLALLVAGVSAHDADQQSHFSRVAIRHNAFAFSLDDTTLLEATGLEAEALRAALMDGATIAELIEANEGDVTALVADMEMQATAAINARSASFLEGLEEQVNEQMHASHARRGFWGRRLISMPRLFAYAGVGDTVMDATGLDAAGLRAALADGATIAELIAANDGDAASLSASIAATITDAVNDAAAARVANLEEDINAAFNTNYAEKWRRWRRFPKPRWLSGSWGDRGMAGKLAGETSEA